MVLSDCVCPGHKLMLECTVVGGGATIWRGTAVDCPSSSNRILLRHSQFASGTSLSCNNGRIIGRSTNTTSDSDGIKFISQLIIQLDESGTLEGRTVECAHSYSEKTIIGTHTIIACTRGIEMYIILKTVFIASISLHVYTYIQTLLHLLKMSIFLKLTGID